MTKKELQIKKQKRKKRMILILVYIFLAGALVAQIFLFRSCVHGLYALNEQLAKKAETQEITETEKKETETEKKIPSYEEELERLHEIIEGQQ